MILGSGGGGALHNGVAWLTQPHNGGSSRRGSQARVIVGPLVGELYGVSGVDLSLLHLLVRLGDRDIGAAFHATLMVDPHQKADDHDAGGDPFDRSGGQSPGQNHAPYPRQAPCSLSP